MELFANFSYNRNVVSLNPTFVEIEPPKTQSLLDQARSGDPEAFSEICRAYETRLLRRAAALCGNVSQAEELTQDTLVEAWKCLHRYNGRCEFFTWLCAILLNRYRNTIRQKRLLLFSTFQRDNHEEFQNRIANLPDHSSSPDEAAQLHEQAARVWTCISTLPAKQQQVVFLRFYVDDSLAGIAGALGCSVGTVKSRLFHALDKLRGMKAINTQFPNLKTKG